MTSVVPLLWGYVNDRFHLFSTDTTSQAVGGAVWHGIKGVGLQRRSSPTTPNSHAVSQLPLRRASHWCPHSDQSARPRARRQLWCLGRSFQHIRLRCQGNKEEGGPLECYHRRFLHGRLPRRARRLQIDAQRRDIVRYPSRSHRRR